jgi:hypothetical protein
VSQVTLRRFRQSVAWNGDQTPLESDSALSLSRDSNTEPGDGPTAALDEKR